MFNEGNQIHNFMSSSGTVINYGSGSGSNFLTSYGSGSTNQKVTVPTVPVPVPVPQHWVRASGGCNCKAWKPTGAFFDSAKFNEEKLEAELIGRLE